MEAHEFCISRIKIKYIEYKFSKRTNSNLKVKIGHKTYNKSHDLSILGLSSKMTGK